MPDAQAEFREELGFLRDRLTRSIRDGLFTEVEQGYAIYIRLIDTVLRQLTYGRLETDSLEQDFYPRDYHSAWRWLQSDIRDFGDAAIESGHERMVVETIDLVSQLAYRSYQESALGALSTLLDLYVYVWQRLLKAEQGEAAHYLLVSLQNLTDYQIGAPNGDAPTAAASEAITFCIRTFVQLLKTAIDVEHIGAFREAADYFRAILSYREGESFEEVPELRQAAWVALAAWVLRSKAEELHQHGSMRMMLSQLLEELRADSLWQAYGRARTESNGGSMYWDRWEFDLLPPMQVGVLSFSEFVDQAAALRALQTARTLVLPTEPTREDADLAGALRTAIDQVVSKDWTNLVSPGLIGRSDLLRSKLDQLIADQRLRWQSELRQAPIEQSRVQTFFQAFEQTLLDNEESRLAKVLVRDEPITEPEGRLSINVVVPKEFFVSTHIHADPQSLGKDFALSLMRAENEYLLGHLQATAKTHRVARPEELRAALKSRVHGNIKRWLAVAINSWQIDKLLSLEDETSQHPDFTPPVAVVYTDTEESACALIDLGKSGYAARDISTYTDEGWRRLVKVGVAGTVQPYFDLSERSQSGSEAKVHVQMYEPLHWIDGAPDAATWFTIEDS
jgi:hypothetical protein